MTIFQIVFHFLQGIVWNYTQTPQKISEKDIFLRKYNCRRKNVYDSKSMKFLEGTERRIILECMHKKQDSRIYKRLHAIILYYDGLSVTKIARLFFIWMKKRYDPT